MQKDFSLMLGAFSATAFKPLSALFFSAASTLKAACFYGRQVKYMHMPPFVRPLPQQPQEDSHELACTLESRRAAADGTIAPADTKRLTANPTGPMRP